MAEYDGSIKVDTRIDSKGFIKGIKNMSSQSMRLRNAIKKTEQDIKDLEAEMEQMKTVQVDSKEFDKLQEKIRETEDSLDSMYEARGRLENEIIPDGIADISSDDDIEEMYAQNKSWQKLTESINKAENELKEYAAESQNLKNASANIEETEQFQKKAKKLQDLNDKLAVSCKRMEELKQKEDGVGKKLSNLASLGNNAVKKLGSGIDKVNGKMQAFSKRIASLVKAALIFNVLRAGLTQLRSYISGVISENKQFANSLANVKRNLSTAFSPILGSAIPVINSFMTVLDKATAKLAVFVNSLFGKNITVNASDTSTALDGVASSAKEAVKQLGHYDELNVINKNDTDTGSSGSGSSVTYEDIEPNNKLLDWLNNIKKVAQPTLDALKKLKDEGLSKLGDFTFTGLKNFYNDFLKPVGEWALGKGISELIDSLNDFLNKIDFDKINSALERLWNALAPFAIGIGEGLIAFFDDLLGIGAEFINLVVPGGLEAIATALEKIDPEVAEAIGYGLGTIATAVITMKAVNLAAGAIMTIISGAEAALATGMAGMSIGAKIGLVIAVAIIGWKLGTMLYEAITGEEAGNWFETDPTIKECIQAIEDGAITEITITPFIRLMAGDDSITTDEVIDAIAMMIEDGVKNIKKIFISDSIEVGPIKDKIAEKWEEVKEWWTNKENLKSISWGAVIPGMLNFVKERWKEAKRWWDNSKTDLKSLAVGNAIPSMLNTMKDRWRETKRWWDNSKASLKSLNIKEAIPSIKSILSEKWTEARNWWNTKKLALQPINFSATINSITGKIKDFVNQIIDVVNKNLIQKLVINFTGPKWLGSPSFKFGPPSDIPHLAKGAVIPPNRQFLAMLGDQTSGTNIETPLATMIEAFETALNNRQNNDSGDIVIQIDRKEVFRATKKEAEQYKKQTGKPAFT